jgi:hypothetical protein
VKNKISRCMLQIALPACLTILGTTAAHAEVIWSPWTAAFVDYPNPVFTAEEIMGSHSPAKYMWYCTGAGDCPTGAERPYMAEFKRTFNIPMGGIDTATAAVLGDDYFSIYVNGQLADSCTSFDFVNQPFDPCVGRTLHGAAAWLDDRQLNGPDQPATPLLIDFQHYLQAGSTNELLMFACDGNPADPRSPAGATPDQAPSGCPNAGSRGYHYALFQGSVNGFGPRPEQEFYHITLNTGELDLQDQSPWQARATSIPEPDTIGLLVAAIAFIGLRGKKNVCRKIT